MYVLDSTYLYAMDECAPLFDDMREYRAVNNCSTSLALCEGNPPVTGGFPSQKASNAGSFTVQS